MPGTAEASPLARARRRCRLRACQRSRQGPRATGGASPGGQAASPGRGRGRAPARLGDARLRAAPTGAPLSPGELPDLAAVSQVSGPEPGYIACSIFVVQVPPGVADSPQGTHSRVVSRLPRAGWACPRPARRRARRHAPRARPLTHPAHASAAATLGLFLQAALTLLEERAQLGVPGGVHTPAALLGRSGYVRRLQERGIKFSLERPPGAAA